MLALRIQALLAEGINARSFNLYSIRIRAWQPRSVQAALTLLNVILSTNLAMTPITGSDAPAKSESGPSDRGTYPQGVLSPLIRVIAM